MLLNLDRMAGIKEQLADLPFTGKPAFLVVGKVRRTHGVHGEVVIEIYTDFPDSLMPKKIIYVGEKHEELTISSLRPHNEGLILAFDGISTPEQAGRFRNKILSIKISEAHRLPKGEFYFHELIEMDVVDENGILLGKLTEILKTGANDVYVVTDNSERDLLIPAIPEVVLSVDLNLKTMKVHILPGLTWE
jgi:16S rRNA processing protein RimM